MLALDGWLYEAIFSFQNVGQSLFLVQLQLELAEKSCSEQPSYYHFQIWGLWVFKLYVEFGSLVFVAVLEQGQYMYRYFLLYVQYIQPGCSLKTSYKR